MNDINSINLVIDKLADKIGTTAEAIRPLTEEVIRQYQTLNLLYASKGIGIILLGVLMWCAGILLSKTERDREWLAIGGAFGTGAIVIGSILTIDFLSKYYAPLPHILGLLR